jgi:hypothetical protein
MFKLRQQHRHSLSFIQSRDRLLHGRTHFCFIQLPSGHQSARRNRRSF